MIFQENNLYNSVTYISSSTAWPMPIICVSFDMFKHVKHFNVSGTYLQIETLKNSVKIVRFELNCETSGMEL